MTEQGQEEIFRLIFVRKMQKGNLQFAELTTNQLTALAFESWAEDWNKPENDHWDDFYKLTTLTKNFIKP